MTENNPDNGGWVRKSDLASFKTAAAPTILVSPSGLRRWRAALARANTSRAPIAVFGDSLVFGQGADGINTATDVPDNTDGWVGQMRRRFADQYGDVSEGAIITSTNASYSSRVTSNTGTGSASTGIMGKGTKLVSGQSFTVAVPAGCTGVGIVQANLTGDVTGQYALDGAAAADIVALTTTNHYIETVISVSPLTPHTIVISGPASAETFIPCVTFRRDTAGVPVHRLGIPGTVVGDMIGGQASGVLAGDATVQDRCVRAGLEWMSGTGLAIISFATNDWNFQGGGGTAAQNSVTPTLFETWLRTAIASISALSWATLLVGPPRAPTGPSVDAGFLENDYIARMATIAGDTDHVAFLDIGRVWGTSDHAHAADEALQIANSVHPTFAGHGDIARIVHHAITNPLLADVQPA